MQSSLSQITDNITRFDDQTKADLMRDVKNKACLAQPAPADAPGAPRGLVPEPASAAVPAAAGAPAGAAPQWNEEDGQRYIFKDYKKHNLDRDDDEHKSARRCLDICKADSNCWIMTHYKPEKKAGIAKQGECWLGDQTASNNFRKEGNGRAFGAYKK
jgi:hypothetical protein